ECEEAFRHSYSINSRTQKKNNNIFTKSCIAYGADKVLTDYFAQNIEKIQTWFNILNQNDKTIQNLIVQLQKLGKI
ncbi:MAG: hypothetical protein J5672_01210, partial [Verrucomicrobia bacterium]|nr:hypothetical protein [Verrucomicrobiota bacterium]